MGKVKVKVKGKVYPRTGHKGPKGEYRYICTLSLNSAIDGCGWSTPRHHRFTPGKPGTLVGVGRRGVTIRGEEIKIVSLIVVFPCIF